MKRTNVVCVFVAAVLAAVLGGCQTDQIGAGGERTAAVKWQRGQVIVGDCLVTFFDETGKEYYSRQRHRIGLSQQFIEVTAREPGGQLWWSLAGDRYSSSSASGDSAGAGASMIDAAVLRALLTCLSASAGQYDSESQERGDPVKMDGIWYTPVVIASGGESSGKVTLFVRMDNSTIDTVSVDDVNTGETVIARIYNAYRLAETEQVLGSKVDISRLDKSGGEPKRVLQVNYQSLGVL